MKSGILTLFYNLDQQIFFEEKIIFPIEGLWAEGRIEDNDQKEALKRVFNALLIAAGISYYKTYCPEIIEIRSENLNAQQLIFWEKLYLKGLGEFFFRNRIDFRGLFRMECRSEKNFFGPIELSLEEKSLVPIGGGKDSLVTAEILNNSKIDFDYFMLRRSEPIVNTAAILNKKSILIGRELSPNISELNAQGALNGHIPITAVLSFILAATAILFKYKYLIMSLEKSANFGNYDYLGLNINHQYSKSEEFEKALADYLKKYICPDLNYFSLLRGMNEIKIAQIFSETSNIDKYLPIFTSCNANFKILKEKSKSLWCGECPKCAFVYLMLAAFIPRKKMLESFGEDFLDKENLQTFYKELLGMENIKPFECVGTPEECIAAMNLIEEGGEYSNSLLMKTFQENKRELIKKFPEYVNVLKTQIPEHLPEIFKKILNNY